mmetsp:Transcript_86044/g.228138  ORF Transcript_86044/g.228138 Transcript_86044/m.228138 type:complete len:286 (-) Transcript_86044:114-971(-)
MRLHSFRCIAFIIWLQLASSFHFPARDDAFETKDDPTHAQMKASAWTPSCRNNITAHRHILFAGDSFSRFMALALIEHMAGSNTYCDVRNSPQHCQGEAKYFDSRVCLDYRSRWCGVPMQRSFCDSKIGNVTNKVTVTSLDMWDKKHFDSTVSPYLQHWSPDIMVGSYMRSLSQGEDEFEQWLQQWCDLASKSGTKFVWVGNHARCMRKVATKYGLQSNTIAKKRNLIARKVMEANGFQMLDPLEHDALNAAAVCKDTQDGTHVGFKSNMLKIESLVAMGLLADV